MSITGLAGQDERRHAKGDYAVGGVGFGVDLVQDEVVAAFDGGAKVLVEAADDKTGERKQGDHPLV